MAFDSRSQLSSFGSSSPATPVTLDTVICLSASDPWLTTQATASFDRASILWVRSTSRARRSTR